MNGPGREEKALAQLVRLARQTLEERQAHLADLETARSSAETSLDWLAQSIRAEEAGATRPQSIVDFRRFLEGATEKRRTLEATRDRLGLEIETVREHTREAFAEMKKLEHLIDINRRAGARRDAKAEASAIDALVAARRR